MNFEKILSSGFKIIKKQPKVVLPNILSLIPITLFYLLLLSGLSKFVDLLEVGGIESLSNLDVLIPLLKSGLRYSIMGIPIFFLWLLIHSFLESLYPSIAWLAQRGRVSLSKAFSVGYRRMLPLVWTYFLGAIVLFLIFGIAIGLIVGSFFINRLIGTVLLIPCILASIPLFLCIKMVFWLLPPIVVIKNQSGINALKTSVKLIKNNLWETILIIIILSIVGTVIHAILNKIPAVGFLLSLIAGLFIGTWSSIVKTIFYLNMRKK